MLRFVSLGLTFELLSACQSRVVTNSDHDQNVNFTEYREFSWIGEHPFIIAGERPADLNPLLENYVMDAVAKNLEAKGFAFSTDPSEVDFAISFTVGVRDRTEILRTFPTAYSIQSYHYNAAWRRGYVGWGSDYYGHSALRARHYREGTLAIDIFDGGSGHPSWHGWAKKTITEDDRANLADMVARVVRKILSDFPPNTNRP